MGVGRRESGNGSRATGVGLREWGDGRLGRAIAMTLKKLNLFFFLITFIYTGKVTIWPIASFRCTPVVFLI